jgi:hypothetical protein
MLCASSGPHPSHVISRVRLLHPAPGRGIEPGLLVVSVNDEVGTSFPKLFFCAPSGFGLLVLDLSISIYSLHAIKIVEGYTIEQTKILIANTKRPATIRFRNEEEARQSKVVRCRICEEEISSIYIQDHTKYCVLGRQSEMESEEVNGRLLKLYTGIMDRLQAWEDNVPIPSSPPTPTPLMARRIHESKGDWPVARSRIRDRAPPLNHHSGTTCLPQDQPTFWSAVRASRVCPDNIPSDLIPFYALANIAWLASERSNDKPESLKSCGNLKEECCAIRAGDFDPTSALGMEIMSMGPKHQQIDDDELDLSLSLSDSLLLTRLHSASGSPVGTLQQHLRDEKLQYYAIEIERLISCKMESLRKIHKSRLLLNSFHLSPPVCSQPFQLLSLNVFPAPKRHIFHSMYCLNPTLLVLQPQNLNQNVSKTLTALDGGRNSDTSNTSKSGSRRNSPALSIASSSNPSSRRNSPGLSDKSHSSSVGGNLHIDYSAIRLKSQSQLAVYRKHVPSVPYFSTMVTSYNRFDICFTPVLLEFSTLRMQGQNLHTLSPESLDFAGETNVRTLTS